jgi:hypothetical protein
LLLELPPPLLLLLLLLLQALEMPVFLLLLQYQPLPMKLLGFSQHVLMPMRASSAALPLLQVQE